MKHKSRLTTEEKLMACFDLSDLIFRMKREILSRSGFNKRLRALREKHLKSDIALLRNIEGAQK